MKPRKNIKPFIIRGEAEFALAFGIRDPRKQAELRSEGLPCFIDGRTFCYVPDKVVKWFEDRGKIEVYQKD